MKPCFRCQKEIDPKSNYYSFTEFNEEKMVNVDYAHRTCWDQFLKSVTDTDQAQNFLKGIDFNSMKNSFRDMGWTKEEEFKII